MLILIQAKIQQFSETEVATAKMRPHSCVIPPVLTGV